MSLVSRSNLSRPVPSRSLLRRRQWLHHRGLITFNLNGSSRGKSLGLLMISGFLGGATATIIGGCAFYHWSGIKNIVDAARHPVEFLKWYRSYREVPVAAGGNARPETNAQILAALRSLAKTYVAPLPGAGILIDIAFNEIDRTVDTLEDEVVSILKSAYSEVQTAVKTRGEDAKKTAWDIVTILRNRLGQVQVSALGQDRIGPIFERLPGFFEHASRHISDAHQSLSPVFQKGLEKGKSVLSGVSRRLKSTLSLEQAEPPASIEPTKTDTETQDGEPVEER